MHATRYNIFIKNTRTSNIWNTVCVYACSRCILFSCVYLQKNKIMEKSSSKSSFSSYPSPLKSNLKSSTAKARSLCWQKSVKEDNANWTTVEGPELAVDEVRRGRLSRRRCSAPCALPINLKSRKPSLKSIQMMKLGSSEVPSVSTYYYINLIFDSLSKEATFCPELHPSFQKNVILV